MSSELPESLFRGSVELALGLQELTRADLEQPMVFFRVGWDFRWLSRKAVVDRLCGDGEQSSIVDERPTEDEPLELEEFLNALRFLVGSEEPVVPVEPTELGGLVNDVQRLAFELATEVARQFQRLSRGSLREQRQRGETGGSDQTHAQKRDVVVLPGGWSRTDTWAAVLVAIDLGAAIVLPPAEGAWAWTVVWAKPSVLVAEPDQLAALAEEISGMRRRKQKRALRKLRWVGALQSEAPPSAESSMGASKQDMKQAPQRRRIDLEWLRDLGPKVVELEPKAPRTT